MKATVTITSKRQVTIPRKMWDALQLDGVKRLDAEVKNGELKLKKDDYFDRIRKMWDKNDSMISGEISDESIRKAKRRAAKRKKL